MAAVTFMFNSGRLFESGSSYVYSLMSVVVVVVVVVVVRVVVVVAATETVMSDAV